MLDSISPYTEFVSDVCVGREYILHRPATVTVCGYIGEYGEIIDLEPEAWYTLDLDRDQVLELLDHSDAFDPLIRVHGLDLVAWCPMDVLVLPNVDNF